MRIAFVAVFVAACSSKPAPGDTATPADAAAVDVKATDAHVTADVATGPFVHKDDPASAVLFSETTVPAFALTFAPTEWQALNVCWKNPPPDVLARLAHCYVHCTFTFAGETFQDAACRNRGDPAKWKDEVKPQLVVRFDKWDDKGRFHGMRRLDLEFNRDYKAPVRDRLGMWLMREAGLAAPRVTHVQLTIDGKNYGPYQNIEPVDKELLESWYANPEGNLFKEADKLETNKKAPDMARHDKLAELLDASGASATSVAQIEALADVSEMLREVAAESALPTADNFTDGGGNFYYYDETPGAGFVLIPWDLDDIFSKYTKPNEPVGSCQGPPQFADGPFQPCVVLLSWPAWKAEYVKDLKAIRDGPLAKLSGKVDEYCKLIRPVVEGDKTFAVGTMADFDADCAAVKKAIADRIAFLKTVD